MLSIPNNILIKNIPVRIGWQIKIREFLSLKYCKHQSFLKKKINRGAPGSVKASDSWFPLS